MRPQHPAARLPPQFVKIVQAQVDHLASKDGSDAEKAAKQRRDALVAELSYEELTDILGALVGIRNTFLWQWQALAMQRDREGAKGVRASAKKGSATAAAHKPALSVRAKPRKTRRSSASASIAAPREAPSVKRRSGSRQADTYRAQASRARHLAKIADRPEAAQALKLMAVDFEEMASRLERTDVGGKSSRRSGE